MKPLFITSPHSGEEIPLETPWLLNLPEKVVMCDVDRFVDRLYLPAVEHFKIPFIKAQWHRYAADLNRWPDDVDEECVVGGKNSGAFPVGMGVHWSKTTQGEILMPKPMDEEKHLLIIEKYFKPFHEAVQKKYEDFFNLEHANVFHIDVHSMPSMGTVKHRDPGHLRPEIVVSDIDGSSCSSDFKDLVIKAYEESGFKVAYNWPYKGGRVTQSYGQPHKGMHAIQVEMRRNLYMDESSKHLNIEAAQIINEKLLQAIGIVLDSIGQEVI